MNILFMRIHILSSPLSFRLFIQLAAPGSVVDEFYCLTAGRFLFVCGLQVSWAAYVFISIHCLEILNCL